METPSQQPEQPESLLRKFGKAALEGLRIFGEAQAPGSSRFGTEGMFTPPNHTGDMIVNALADERAAKLHNTAPQPTAALLEPEDQPLARVTVDPLASHETPQDVDDVHVLLTNPGLTADDFARHAFDGRNTSGAANHPDLKQ